MVVLEGASFIEEVRGSLHAMHMLHVHDMVTSADLRVCDVTCTHRV